MRFELDDILTDEILFYMENQDSDFLLDSQEGHVVDILCNEYEEIPDTENGRYITLPEWSSQDGYHLMEKFAAMQKNPVLRQELSAALNRNRGVFRAFKSILEQYPEYEKKWFKFKEQEMKKEIIVWYNSLREEWGLEPIGIEPEDTSSLVLEDFIIKEKEDFNFTVESSNGELAGTISANINASVLHTNNLDIKSEYRCMGLGKTLLSRLIEKAEKHGLDVTIDLPAEMDFFSRSLYLENFKPYMQRFIRQNKK